MSERDAMMSAHLLEEDQDIELNGITLRGANKVLDFDQALELYSHNPKRWSGFQMIYQKVSFVAVCIGILSSSPIQFGMLFLTNKPT
jgi:hypothetical protein